MPPVNPARLRPPPRLYCRTCSPKETDATLRKEQVQIVYETACIVFGEDRFRPSLPEFFTVCKVSFGGMKGGHDLFPFVRGPMVRVIGRGGSESPSTRGRRVEGRCRNGYLSSIITYRTNRDGPLHSSQSQIAFPSSDSFLYSSKRPV